MTGMFSISRMEIKKIFDTSTCVFLIILFIATIIDNVLYYQMNLSKSVELSGNIGISLFIIQIYFIYLGSNMIGSDFSFGTSKMVFSSMFSRSQIIHIKSVSFLFYTSLYGIFNILVGLTVQLIIGKHFSSMEILSTLFSVWIVYIVYFASILSVGIFTISITFNRVYSLIAGYVLYIFLYNIGIQIVERDESWMKTIMENTPFYIASDGFSTLYYNINDIIYLSFFSVVIYIIGLYIIKKRDLK
ncbi:MULTISPECIES: hypothetical protein [Lysinibacillus]|uniref:hypothetical protein n=1 Tax=Lysinibacillus TaxID=400634 RepID=UPI00214B9856|nr:MULTISPECIES: hypothetical protein [Lysinibacillus]UUV24726.1 hypothetical protein NP781_23750 [Lysinibacillus sp. FN11]UYB47597.1 hypothetical protein OCI51_01110 [Lysinibacillus capsici]